MAKSDSTEFRIKIPGMGRLQLNLEPGVTWAEFWDEASQQYGFPADMLATRSLVVDGQKVDPDSDVVTGDEKVASVASNATLG